MTTVASLRALPHSFSMAGAVLLIGFATSLTGPYLPLFGSQVAHMTPLSLGLFQSLLAVSSILISFQLGRLSDRLSSRRPLVLLAAGAAALGFVLFTSTTHYLALCLIAFSFLGTGAATFPQLFAFARSRLGGVTPQVAEHGLTTLRSVFSLAWVVGPGLGALVVAASGFRGLFLVTALLYALVGVVVLRSGQGEPRRATLSGAPTQGQGALPASGTLSASGSRPPLALIVSSFVLYGASMSMGFIVLPLFVTQELHLPSSDVGLLVGVCALLEIPIMLSFVFLPRRFSNQTLLLLAFGLFAAYFLIMGLSHSLAPMLAAQLIRAAVIAVSASLGMAYFQELLPGRLGQATTLFVNTNSAGSMVAGLASGAFAQALSYRAVFLLCAALTLAACGLLLLAHRQNVKVSSLH